MKKFRFPDGQSIRSLLKTASSVRLARYQAVRRVQQYALGISVITFMLLSIFSMSKAQGNPPDIRGNYSGQATVTVSNCVVTGEGQSDFIPVNGSNTFPIVFNVFDQAGGKFSAGFFDSDSGDAGLAISGTVSESGGLNGSISFSDQPVPGIQVSLSGTFTGQFATNSINVNIVDQAKVVLNDPPTTATCDETITFSGTRVQPTANSDLAITSTAAPDPVASGGRLTYTQRVTNSGPDAAMGVSVSEAVPDGTTFSSITVSQGTANTPAVGSAGQVICSLGTIPSGGSATITLTVNVLAASGQTLSDLATVGSLSADPKASNNSVTTTTAVQGGAIVRLVWEQPAPTAANPTPAPINLRVVPSGLTSSSPESSTLAKGEPQKTDTPCTLVNVNVYKSEAQPVQTIPSNLWKTVPPDQLQTAMAAAPAGSFYVITNVWQCGDMTIESGGSNQAGVPAGPVINKVKVSAKMKVTGSDFSDPSEVFIDGVGFSKAAAVTNGELILQKGSLTDGRSLIDATPVGRTVIISVRKSNGGLSSLAFTRK